jgi:hypothetical protein
MRTRKYLRPVAGLAMSLALSGIAFAGFSSDHWVNKPVGTNNPDLPEHQLHNIPTHSF